jgi:hypothetical protein
LRELQSGRFGDEKKPLIPAGIRTPDRPVNSLVTRPTEPSQLQTRRRRRRRKIKYVESSLELKMVNSYLVPIIHFDYDN